ncbi:MAG: hypothetical protein ACJ0GN_02200 [Candidatus Actinomarina sp.]|nr:MAG: hypothetical protein CND04_00475 [Candidatus Actinomarinales bacterium MED-G02]|tara:strand:- start:294 stop:662 length:369 start_codon:yes stop_codon:yes gene_type:complete
MSSTFVLVSLLLSLSMAVLVPEIKDSKKTIFSFSPEYDHMVNKQRKGFLTIGLLAVSTFFISIQTLSVPIFVLHLVLDVLFGVYAYISFQVRRATLLQNSLVGSSFASETITQQEDFLQEAG